MVPNHDPLAGSTPGLAPCPFIKAMEEWAQDVLCISRGFRRVVDGVEIFDTEARLAREREFGVPEHELYLRIEANRKFAEQDERRRAAERRLDRSLRRIEARKRSLRLIKMGKRGDGRPRRACTLGKNYKV